MMTFLESIDTTLSGASADTVVTKLCVRPFNPE